MSNTIAPDALLDQLATDESKGAVVHNFNPEASATEKAATAGKAFSSISDGSARQPQGKRMRPSPYQPSRRRLLLATVIFSC
jgi:hypothetical protein